MHLCSTEIFNALHLPPLKPAHTHSSIPSTIPKLTDGEMASRVSRVVEKMKYKQYSAFILLVLSLYFSLYTLFPAFLGFYPHILIFRWPFISSLLLMKPLNNRIIYLIDLDVSLSLRRTSSGHKSYEFSLQE